MRFHRLYCTVKDAQLTLSSPKEIKNQKRILYFEIVKLCNCFIRFRKVEKKNRKQKKMNHGAGGTGRTHAEVNLGLFRSTEIKRFGQRNIDDFISITNLQRQNWLEDRRKSIHANDAPNGIGINTHYYMPVNARHKYDEPFVREKGNWHHFGNNGIPDAVRGIANNAERPKTPINARRYEFNYDLPIENDRVTLGVADNIAARKRNVNAVNYDIFDALNNTERDEYRPDGRYPDAYAGATKKIETAKIDAWYAQGEYDSLKKEFDIYFPRRNATSARNTNQQFDVFNNAFLDFDRDTGMNAVEYGARPVKCSATIANNDRARPNGHYHGGPDNWLVNDLVRKETAMKTSTVKRNVQGVIKPPVLRKTAMNDPYERKVNIDVLNNAFIDPGRDIGMNAIIHERQPIKKTATTTTNTARIDDVNANAMNTATNVNVEYIPENIVIKQEPVSPKRTKSPPSTLYSQLQALGDRGGFITNAEEFDCIICMTTTEVGDGVILRLCLHQFCYECIKNAIILSDDAEISCPFGDGTTKCEGLLLDLEIRAILTKNEYDKYLVRSLRIAEGTIANTVHCRVPNCDGWCICEDGVNQFVCPKCEAPNCVSCQVTYELRSQSHESH